MSLQFSCPDGGDFYVCAERGQFVGCCMADPCGMTGCSAGNLRPAHFPSDQYATFPDQQCDDGSFYTCQTSGFMGCCRKTPCDVGCSASDLASVHLTDNAALAEPFLSLNSTWLATHGSTSTHSSTSSSMTTQTSRTTQVAGTTTTSLPSVSPTPEKSITPLAPTQRNSLNVGAVVGGAVGGFFVLALLIVMTLWLRRRRLEDKVDASTSSIPARMGEQRLEPLDQHKHLDSDNPSFSVSEPQSSPQSPPPPEYLSHTWSNRNTVHELAGVTEWELDSGQRYHPYRSWGQQV